MLDLLTEYCAGAGMPLSVEQVERFEAYLGDLYAVNATMNLTRVPREEAELRHLIDSLLVAEFLPAGAEVVDLGTGPGLPAWALACARPDLKVTAVDSSGKMLDFLRRHPLSNLTVVQGRAEDLCWEEVYDAATGRAIAPLGIQLELSCRMLRVGGRAVPFRTTAEREAIRAFPAKKLGIELSSLEERKLPGTDIIRLFPIFTKIAKTPGGFPRSWAQIKANPIS
ncbi:MAG: class I SAM-dependent methyltransferase [Fimbriimonadaceae bacterium]|nr:class I SAM-dependent methyltransferase [Fimbriimonadaceae bacterium]